MRRHAEACGGLRGRHARVNVGRRHLPRPMPQRTHRLLAVLLLLPAASAAAAQTAARPQPVLGTRSAPVIERDGLRFRDLNRDGTLDPYEDWRLTPDARARDLVGRMTLEEKAGAMMHGTARSTGPMGMAGVGTQYDTALNRALIEGARVTSMITRVGGAPQSLAEQNNRLQE